MKLFVSIFLIGLVMLASPVAWAKKKGETSAGPSVSPASSTSPATTPPRFNIPIPVGHDAEGVKLPYFDERGRIQMFFTIDKAMRVDLDHLDMQDAYMQTYDEKGVPDVTVYMTRSLLDLNTHVVTSDIPVTVRREDFEITGNKMVFNTQTRVGHMSGHVRMVIYNRQEMAHASPSPKASPKPSASPQ